MSRHLTKCELDFIRSSREVVSLSSFLNDRDKFDFLFFEFRDYLLQTLDISIKDHDMIYEVEACIYHSVEKFRK